MKKLLTITAAALLATCLASCGSLNEKPNPVVAPSEVPTEVAEEKSSLVLPKVPGVKITSNHANPQIGDYVELTVTVLNNSQKRIDAVTVDQQVLEAKEINGNTRKYGFIMRSEAATIDVVAVTLYGISVAEDVADKLALYGIEGNVAAAGDVVEFAPSSLPGFWFYGVAPVEDDVTIAPVEDKAGWFSFTMPEHAVTFTSTVGKNVYKLGFNSDKTMLGENEIQVWSASGVTPNKYYEYGEALRFRVYNQSQSYKVSGVKMEGEILTPGENDWYELTMPAFDVDLEVTYDPWYRSVVAGDVDSAYELTLKTVVDGEEVLVTDSNVVAGQEVRAYVVNSLADAHYSPTLQLKTGADAEKATVSTSTTITYDEEGGYYTFTLPSQEYTQVDLIKNYHIIANDPMVGEYEAGMKGYYGGNFYAKVTESGELYYTSGSVSTDETPSYSGTVYDITFPDTENLSFAEAKVKNGTTIKDLYFGEDVMIACEGTSRNAAYIYARGKGHNVMSKTDGGTVSYAYYTMKDSKLETEFFHMTCENGEVVTAFFDAVNKKVYWDVTTTVVAGTDGFTKDDKIIVKSAEGELLAYYSLVKKDNYNNGYQHECSNISLDGLQGTYAPASETDGTSSIVVTGYGKASIGETEYSYVIDNGVCVLTAGEEVIYVKLNAETMTYAASAAPTDALEGTYTGDAGDLVLDGYGHCTLNGAEGTYTFVNGVITLVIGETEIIYALNVEEKTYAEVPPYEVTLGTYTFVDDGEKGYKSNNQHKGSTDATYTITANKAVTVTVSFKVSSETDWDYFYVKKNNTALWERKEANCSGSSMTVVTKTYELAAGDTLSFIYHKDGSGDQGSDTAWITSLVVGDTTLIGA